MILNNLTEGLIIKNYRELCNLIGEKVKTGEAKINQLNKLSEYVEYIKDGNKFIITKILTEIEIVDSQIKRGRKSVYGDMIEVLLLDELAKNDSHLIISKSNLIRNMGLVNDNYKRGYGNQLLLASKLEMTVDYVNEFYKLNDSNLTNVINATLKSLSNKKLIDYKMTTMIKIEGERQHREILPHERLILLEIDKECLNKFDIKSLDGITKYNDSGLYHKIRDYRNKLIRERTNIEFHYNAFDIVINHNYLEQEKTDLTKHILSEMERLNELEKLNLTFGDNIVANAEKRHKNNTKLTSIRRDYDYVLHFKSLVNELIDLNADDLEFKDVLNSSVDALLPF